MMLDIGKQIGATFQQADLILQGMEEVRREMNGDLTREEEYEIHRDVLTACYLKIQALALMGILSEISALRTHTMKRDFSS